MTPPDPAWLAAADKRHLWHPFTQMRDWCAPEHDPLLLVSGRGALVRDAQGREYLDGNSSIWTNIHGHAHPAIDAAIRAQLERVAHTSFLGFSNPPAIELAAELLALWPGGKLTRLFYSDDGSTAIEVALRMAAQFWQLSGHPERREFVAFTGAYHGDTMGAASLGGIPLFHDRLSSWRFPVRRAESLDDLASLDPQGIAAVAIEPLVQGAAGMRLWAPGTLRKLRHWCDSTGVLLIADEVLTGFGRTGTMFASEQEDVVPDFVALAKGLTGGYLPLAATLTTEPVFEAFLGTFQEQKTFYYGHSYTGNQLGCAAALASLRLFHDEQVLPRLQPMIALLSRLLKQLKADTPFVGEVRQCGFIAAIELVQRTGAPFPAHLLTGARVCHAARSHGLLTRPIRDAVILMPPLCTTESQLCTAVEAIQLAIRDTLG
jgi:adenosylmethionine-8-amino-7-oxononanoate aminotransferase